MERVWITWETQRRNQSMSQALGAKLYELDYSHLPMALRYLKSSVITLAVLKKEKPNTLFVQNPSLVLATIAVLVSKLTKINVVVDAHNGGVKPKDGRSRVLNIWAKTILKASPITIVTNEIIETEILENVNAEIVVLPDPLPVIPAPTQLSQLKGQFNILFICTWAPDEPYLNVIKAAELLDSGVCIYITGNYSKQAQLELSSLPTNVVLTGFIPVEEFDNLLYSVDIVMDLTTREGCLVCGAYEGVSAGKPLVLSKTHALQNYFSNMVYTNNDPSDIAKCIKTILDNLSDFREKSKNLRTQLDNNWNDMKRKFEMKLDADFT